MTTTGDTIWIYDDNFRVYTKGSVGSFGDIIWREHWRPHTITGETRVSWILGKLKIKKATYPHQGIAYSQEEITEQEYIWTQGYKIGMMVGRIKDYATLKQVANLIGYEESK